MAGRVARHGSCVGVRCIERRTPPIPRAPPSTTQGTPRCSISSSSPSCSAASPSASRTPSPARSSDHGNAAHRVRRRRTSRLPALLLDPSGEILTMTANGWLQLLLILGGMRGHHEAPRDLPGPGARPGARGARRSSIGCSARSSASSIASSASTRPVSSTGSVTRSRWCSSPAVPCLSPTRCCALQHLLPLNPQNLAAVRPDLAFNTAVSFVDEHATGRATAARRR